MTATRAVRKRIADAPIAMSTPRSGMTGKRRLRTNVARTYRVTGSFPAGGRSTLRLSRDFRSSVYAIISISR
jgi:hypothetical protein